MSDQVLPCFYPTTTILIDDDHKLSEKLICFLELKDKPHQSFTDGSQGVDHINNNHYGQRLARKLSHVDERQNHPGLTFKLEDLFDETLNSLKYYQPSVLIVDYEMPGMNGIEVCQTITNPHIKKIMFKGSADESVAV